MTVKSRNCPANMRSALRPMSSMRQSNRSIGWDSEAARQPETYIEILKKATRAAPIGMLAAAFVGGMLFARRR